MSERTIDNHWLSKYQSESILQYIYWYMSIQEKRLLLIWKQLFANFAVYPYTKTIIKDLKEGPTCHLRVNDDKVFPCSVLPSGGTNKLDEGGTLLCSANNVSVHTDSIYVKTEFVILSLHRCYDKAPVLPSETRSSAYSRLLFLISEKTGFLFWAKTTWKNTYPMITNHHEKIPQRHLGSLSSQWTKWTVTGKSCPGSFAKDYKTKYYHTYFLRWFALTFSCARRAVSSIRAALVSGFFAFRIRSKIPLLTDFGKASKLLWACE